MTSKPSTNHIFDGADDVREFPVGTDGSLTPEHGNQGEIVHNSDKIAAPAAKGTTAMTPTESNQSAPVPESRLRAASRLYFNQLMAAEISSLTRYCDEVIQVMPRMADDGLLLSLIDCPNKRVAQDVRSLSTSGEKVSSDSRTGRSVVLLSGNLNHAHDFEETLADLKPSLSRFSRVTLVVYNSYFRWLYLLANRVGLRHGEAPSTFVTTADIHSLAKLAGYEVVRMRPAAYLPIKLGPVSRLINKVLPLIPLVRNFSLASIVVLRPIIADTTLPSLSIVIPARNEKGNIENALKRMPDLDGAKIEVIFVEGHSSDGTWEEIQRVAKEYGSKFSISTFQQTGRGKADAVRIGFANAKHELLTILDADLTMPPELLGRFYQAFTKGLGDFINGNRLLYPMEGQAMKFLNKLGNVFFAKSLSAVLGTRLGDSLCGTKLVTKRDYDRMGQWRNDFGDFDPFGDFELLFPAAELSLGIVDIPIRYRDRVYGTTNIRRFYHGMMLLKMTVIGLIRVKLGKAPR